MIVRLTAKAESDLEAIGDWIARDSSTRALSFTIELREACFAIGQLPEGYPILARYERYGVRRRVHGNYLIFYRIQGRAVEVLHILHGAGDYEAIFFPGG